MTFTPLFYFYTFFFAARSPQPLPVQPQAVLRAPYKDTTKRWKNKVFWQKQVLSPLSVIESLYTKNAPGGPCSSPGASYVRYALAHTAGIYSISIRFGFSGRAFVC